MTVINFNKAKKARATANAKALAAASRAKHGQTKGEKALVKSIAQKARELLDGAKRSD
ncbi:MAG: DUF4169 domain-containing protein [Phenylobacterium zucineum]|nr:MAG: DUF4169 domain-containing protein [Phenylobacterium zucineum]